MILAKSVFHSGIIESVACASGKDGGIGFSKNLAVACPLKLLVSWTNLIELDPISIPKTVFATSSYSANVDFRLLLLLPKLYIIKAPDKAGSLETVEKG